MQAMRPKDFEELGSPKSEKAPFVRQIVYEIRRTSGFRGFYSGIQANLLKGVLASSISFGIWENLKNLINYKSKWILVYDRLVSKMGPWIPDWLETVIFWSKMTNYMLTKIINHKTVDYTIRIFGIPLLILTLHHYLLLLYLLK